MSTFESNDYKYKMLGRFEVIDGVLTRTLHGVEYQAEMLPGIEQQGFYPEDEESWSDQQIFLFKLTWCGNDGY